MLKEHLVKGYTIYKPRIAEQGVQELEQAMKLLQKMLTNNTNLDDISKETIQWIMNYAKTWHLLMSYDDGTLTVRNRLHAPLFSLSYSEALQSIHLLKNDLIVKNEATDIFGNELNYGLQAILGNLEQTFDGEQLYNC